MQEVAEEIRRGGVYLSVWESYRARMEVHGSSRRQRALNHTQNYYSLKLPASLSYHHVLIDGNEQDVAILNQKEDLTIKKICSLPGESLIHGGIVDFAGSKWLITELDANDEVYANGIMRRCNYVLKWLNSKGEIIEKWCVVEDGTKYLIGERQEDIMAVGDARFAVTITKDKDTNELGRGRRFLIDDMDSRDVLAFEITKPNKLFNNYDGHGVFRFILGETNLTDNDNVELRIADYYNWQPDRHPDNEHRDKDIPLSEIVDNANSQEFDDEKAVWL